MAVKTYLQTAITQVQAAMADMQSQIHDLQRQTDNMKHQLTQECTRLEQERGLHLTAMGRLQDDNQKHVLQARVSEINKQVDEKKAQMSQADSQTAATLQRKNTLYKNLYNATGELTRLMSLPDIG